MSTANSSLNVEVVMIGFHDPRLGKPAPFGFAMRAGERVSVHHRTDIARCGLPKLFAYTTKNLPKIILQSYREAKDRSRGLHALLLENCFDGLGDFRCWRPISQAVAPEELDAFVIALRSLVDHQMGQYFESLADYKAECLPTSWERLPAFEHPPQMPELTPA